VTEAPTPCPLLIAADIRFPLERANGVQILKTAHALARSGMSVTLLVRHSDERSDAEILPLFGLTPRPGLRIRRLRVGHRRGRFLVSRVRYLAGAGLAAWGAARRGAVVFTRDLQLADALLALPFGPRLVYEAHAVEASMYRERGALYGRAETPRHSKAARLGRRERRVWLRAHGLVTTTAGIRDTFAASYGTRSGETRVLPNGCDAAPPGHPFPGLSAERPPRILYAGQLYPWKGVDVLVDAMAEVPEARLAIVGGLPGEPDLERIRARVAERGLRERTELLGTIPQVQVAAELARAAVVVVPPLRSVMTERHMSPIKALEGMAAGRPVVASDLASCRELLTHERTALLVPPGEPAPLAGAIRRLLVDRELAERLARGAWDAAPGFSWDARAVRLRELFEKVGATA